MGELSARNFGLLIAYLLPGFLALVAISTVSPAVATWIGASPNGQPTVAGFLYVTIASLGLGMFASSLRWLVIDTIHHRTGIEPPAWDFSQLQSNLAAYGLLVEFHYRHYQFYANSFVVLALAYLIRLAGVCQACGGPGWVDVSFLSVEAVLFATSRDTLRKYYARVSHVLAASGIPRKERHHGKRRRPRPQVGKKRKSGSGETENAVVRSQPKGEEEG